MGPLLSAGSMWNEHTAVSKMMGVLLAVTRTRITVFRGLPEAP